MSLLSKLFGNSEDQKLNKEQIIEANACPNCWGIQEYDNKFIDYVEDQTKSNINHEKTNQKAFVQQFVETHVTGILLKKDGDDRVCEKCKVKY